MKRKQMELLFVQELAGISTEKEAILFELRKEKSC